MFALLVFLMYVLMKFNMKGRFAGWCSEEKIDGVDSMFKINTRLKVKTLFWVFFCSINFQFPSFLTLK